MTWYIIDADDKVIATANYKPDEFDLNKRSERCVESLDDIEIVDAEFKKNKVVRRKKTADELAEEERLKQEHLRSKNIVHIS